jgi:hypothetical protein
MTETNAVPREALTQRVSTGVRALDTLDQRLQRSNAGLLISGIVTSAASTLVTAVTAAQGPVVGTGPDGWRLACTVAAVFSFGATVTVGLNQRLKVSERLAEARQCAGRLRSLEVALETDTRPWREVAGEYEEIVKTYPDLVR